MKTAEVDHEEIIGLTMHHLVYGHASGYSMNHKGKSNYFRSECNLEKVRKFHEKFFHASNCCLVVVGDIEKEELFRALIPVLHNALRCHRVKPVWTKPWHEEPIVELEESINHQLEYPYSFIEHPVLFPHSQVSIGFVLPPSTFKTFYHNTAVRLLLEYLTTGPLASALSASMPNQALHEKLEGLPFGSTGVTPTVFEFKQNVCLLNFKNVPIELAPNIPQILRKTLTSEARKGIFRIRKMVKLILDYHQEDLYLIENSPEEKISNAVRSDFLYSTGDNDTCFDRKVNNVYTFHHLLSQGEEYWEELLQTCLLDTKWMTVVALPSQPLFEKLQAETSERVEWRLGSENSKYMKRWAQRLKTALKMVTRNPPPEYLKKYPLPSADSIGNIKIFRQDNPSWANDTMCNLYVDDINTNHAYLTVILDTSELSVEQRRHLVLFAEAICTAPYIDVHEKFHTAKEVEREIKKDLINHETFIGLDWYHPGSSGNPDTQERPKFFCGNFPHLLCLRLQMEVTKVREGFYWAQVLLWNTKWHGDHLKDVALKLAKDAEEMLNEGGLITKALLTDFLYHADSTPKCASMVRQKIFLRQIADELPKSTRRISKILESIRTCILRPDNVTVHFATSLPRMEFHLTDSPDSRFVLSELFRTTFNCAEWFQDGESKRLSKAPDSSTMKSADHIRKFCTEIILPTKSSLGYLTQVAPGVNSFSDPEYPLVLTTIEFFVHEPHGPLFKYIMQAELAEKVDIRVNPMEGLIYFELSGCADLTAAYSRTYEVMTKYLFNNRDGDGDSPGGNTAQWDNFLLQYAKSSLIFKLTQLENTPVKMGMFSLCGNYRGLTLKNTRNIMDAITKVTMKQVQTIARRYFYPLFLQPATCAAAAPTERVFAVIDGLMQ